jgi:hypothetical protein
MYFSQIVYDGDRGDRGGHDGHGGGGHGGYRFCGGCGGGSDCGGRADDDDVFYMSCPMTSRT